MITKLISTELKGPKVLLVSGENPYRRVGGLGMYVDMMMKQALKSGYPMTAIVPMRSEVLSKNANDLVVNQDLSTRVNEILRRNFYFQNSMFNNMKPSLYQFSNPQTFGNYLLVDTDINSLSKLEESNVGVKYDSNGTGGFITKTCYFRDNGTGGLCDADGNYPAISDFQPELRIRNIEYSPYVARVVYLNWVTAALTLADETYKVLHMNDWHCGFYPVIRDLLSDKPSPNMLYTLHNIFNPKFDDDSYKYLFGCKQKEHPLLSDSYYKAQSVIGASKKRVTVSEGFRSELGQYPSIPQETIGDFSFITNGSEPRYDIMNSTFAKKTKISSTQKLMGIKQQEKTQLIKESGLASNKQSLLFSFIHRWDNQKGYSETFDIFGKLLQTEIGANALLVATCDSTASNDIRLRASIAEKFKGRIAIVDYNDEIAVRMFWGSDMFLAPSTTHEPCMIQLLNAKAAGTPVLGSNMGGPKSLIDVGKNGFLFNTGSKNDGMLYREPFMENYRALLTHVLMGYSDGTISLPKMSWNAYQSRTKYSWENAFAQYVDLYKQTAGQPE